MEQVQSTDGTRIAFDRTGSGPALVLIVGAFNDRNSTKTLASKLASMFSVYEYDRRGRGDSGDAAIYSPQHEVDDLGAVIRAAGESAFVFGHSSGACLALEGAAAGVPIRGLAVYEPPYSKWASYEFADRLEQLVKSGRRSEAVYAFMTALGMPPAAIEGMKSSPFWANMEAMAHTLPYDVRLCNNGSVPRERLAKISVATLALAGGNSAQWFKDGARAIAEAVQNGEARVIEGQDHGIADEVLVPILEQFFIGQRVPAQ